MVSVVPTRSRLRRGNGLHVNYCHDNDLRGVAGLAGRCVQQRAQTSVLVARAGYLPINLQASTGKGKPSQAARDRATATRLQDFARVSCSRSINAGTPLSAPSRLIISASNLALR